MQEKQYTFDVAFSKAATNGDVYSATIAPLTKQAPRSRLWIPRAAACDRHLGATEV